jgi:hypothetical protein
MLETYAGEDMKKFEANEKWPKDNASGVFAERRKRSYVPLLERIEEGPLSEVIKPPLNEDELKIEIERVPYMSMPEARIPRVRVTHKPSGIFAQCEAHMTREENEHAARLFLSFKLNDWKFERKMELSRSAPTTPRKNS